MSAPLTTQGGVFIDFVSTSFGTLHGIAYDMCQDTTLAKDLVQETYIRLFGVHNGVADKLNIGYAKRTLTNLACDHFRKEAAQRKMVEKVESMVELLATDPGGQVDSNAYLVWLLKDLPPRQQEVLFLRYSGFSMIEVGELLGIAVGTGYRYLEMALNHLRERIISDK